MSLVSPSFLTCGTSFRWGSKKFREFATHGFPSTDSIGKRSCTSNVCGIWRGPCSDLELVTWIQRFASFSSQVSRFCPVRFVMVIVWEEAFVLIMSFTFWTWHVTALLQFRTLEECAGATGSIQIACLTLPLELASSKACTIRPWKTVCKIS